MVVQLAQPRDMTMRDPRQGPLYQPTAQPMEPQEKSAASQMTDMMANKAMTATVDKGASLMNKNVIAPAGEALTGMFSGAAPTANIASQVGGATAAELAAGAGGEAIGTLAANAATPALTSAAGTAAGTSAAAAGGMGAGMAALGTAVPYIGAAMLAGKAFGLFSDGGHVGPLSKVEYNSAGGPTRGARVDSTGQPFNAASMFKEISNMPNENALIQEVMDKYNVNAYEAAVMIAESQGNQMNQDFLLNTAMEEIFDGPSGHGLTAEKILNSAPNYVKEKYPNYVGPISQIQYKSAGGEAYTVKYGGPLSAK